MLPQHILDRFSRIQPDISSYYGVFNKILHEVFSIEGGFIVAPYYPISPGSPFIDFVITYVVEVKDLPILFLEINPPLHLDSMDSRVAADAKMRAGFRALYDITPMPKLHAISVMGQKLAFYCLDKATSHVNPAYVAPSTGRMVDTVPADRWDTDITTEEGCQRFMAVIDEVKQMAAAL